MADGSWDAAMRGLYAGALAKFVARRTALARQVRATGDRGEAAAIAALRKPTTAADAVNRVVLAGHPAVPELHRVGDTLRQAQSALDAAGLASLRAPRDEVIQTWVQAAGQLSGPHTAAVQTEIRGTVIAALADVGATEVVCSGVLTRALSYSGFGEVDISDAVARTSTGVLLTALDGGRSRSEERPEGAEPAPSGKEPEDEPAVTEAEVTAARADVAAAERERARCLQEVAQAGRLLAQAQRRAAAAQTTYEQALARHTELTGEE